MKEYEKRKVIRATCIVKVEREVPFREVQGTAGMVALT